MLREQRRVSQPARARARGMVPARDQQQMPCVWIHQVLCNEVQRGWHARWRGPPPQLPKQDLLRERVDADAQVRSYRAGTSEPLLGRGFAKPMPSLGSNRITPATARLAFLAET